MDENKISIYAFDLPGHSTNLDISIDGVGIEINEEGIK